MRTIAVLIGVLLVFGGGNLRGLAGEIGGLLGLLLILAGIATLLLISVAVNYLAWTRTEFFFDASGDFRLDSGILQRNERRLTLSRLQSADINRPLLGRVVGLSQLRIEVAGGGDSRVVLSYLSDADAQALRAEIIARAAGMAPDVGEAPEAVLATVPTNDLVVSLLLRSETMILFGVTILVVLTVTMSEGPSGLLLILVTGGLPLLTVFGQFGRFFGFTVADSPDGLRIAPRADQRAEPDRPTRSCPGDRDLRAPAVAAARVGSGITQRRRSAVGAGQRPGARAAPGGPARRGPSDHRPGHARGGSGSPGVRPRSADGPSPGVVPVQEPRRRP